MQTNELFRNLTYRNSTRWIIQTMMIKRILFLFLTLAVCLTLPTDSLLAQEGSEEFGPNLLQNPSFESGMNPWAGYGSTGVVGTQTCCAKDGTRSAYLEPNGNYMELYQNVSITPGARYRLKVFVYTNGVTANLGYYSTTTGDLTCASTSATTYTKLVCTFVIPPDPTTSGATNFNVHLWANGPSGKRVTIDHWTLKQLKAGPDFVSADLRVDQPAVNQSGDYTTLILAGNKPNPLASGSGFTAGWLGIDLAANNQTPAPNGKKYPDRFTQVGLLTDSTGVRWFAWSEEGNYQPVECLRGSQLWPNLGCAGNYNDLVSQDQWRKVELVTYGQGFWIARIYDQNGTGYDVAKIFSSSEQVYRVTNTTEEAYQDVVGPDPNMRAEFLFYHPKYMVWGTGFQEWSATSGNLRNFLWTWPEGICPNFYGAVNYEPRYWFAGSGGQTCDINPLF